MSTKKSKATLNNAQINGSNSWLSRLANGTTDPILAYRIAQNLKPVAELAEQYQTTTRQIIEDNGAVVEDGQFAQKDNKIVFATPEGEAAANSALTELAQLENEVEYYPIKLSRIAAGAKIGEGLIVPMFMALAWMVVDDVLAGEDDDDE
jgi:hypothetical protein